MKRLREEIAALSAEQREVLSLLMRDRGIELTELLTRSLHAEVGAPLSSTQERLWTSGQLARGTPYGNVAVAFRLFGPLEVRALKLSIMDVAHRHAVLRSIFPEEHGKARQVTEPQPNPGWEEVDLRALPARARLDHALRRVKEEARRPFDPTREQLLRITVMHLGEDEWLLVLVTHHLVTDGWGLRILFEEVSRFYRGHMAGEPVALPQPRIQYAEYASWEIGWLDGEEAREHASYWKSKLAGAPARLSLPCSRPRTSTPSLRSACVDLVVSEPVSAALRRLSKANGSTLYMTLLTAFQGLLSRETGQTDVVVGTTVSNRRRSETEALIGNFGNNVLLRADLSGDPPFSEALARVREVVLGAYAHQELPLEALLGHGDSGRFEARLPAFQIMFVLRDGAISDRLDLPGIRAEAVPAEVGTSNLDLILDLTDSAREISGHLEYRCDLFEESVVRRAIGRFQTFLEGVIADPQRRLSELPLGDASGGVGLNAELLRSPSAPPAEVAGPRTPTELWLAELWREILEVEQVGVHDNFFDAGGDSLLVMYLIARVEREIGVRLNPADLMLGTLEQLAAHCDQSSAHGFAPVPRDGREALAPDSRPPDAS